MLIFEDKMGINLPTYKVGERQSLYSQDMNVICLPYSNKC